MKVAAPAPRDFFASRAGVCVYVKMGLGPIRVCFPSPTADGRVEASEVETNDAEVAIAVATKAFGEHRAALAPLFDVIEGASELGSHQA